jgi:hypothetical protein
MHIEKHGEHQFLPTNQTVEAANTSNRRLPPPIHTLFNQKQRAVSIILNSPSHFSECTVHLLRRITLPGTLPSEGRHGIPTLHKRYMRNRLQLHVANGMSRELTYGIVSNPPTCILIADIIGIVFTKTPEGPCVMFP